MTTQQTLDSSTSWVEFITKYSTILINFAKLSKFLLKFSCIVNERKITESELNVY